MRQPLIIYGGGLLGKQLQRWINHHTTDQFELLGFADDFAAPNTCLGTLSDIANVESYAPNRAQLLFAIGYSNMPARHAAYLNAKKLGYQFASFVHPSASVEPDAQLAEGTIIAAQCAVDVECHIGPCNFLDIGTIICERVHVGECNYFCPAVTIGGNTVIGNANFMGMATVVRDGLTIGNLNQIPTQGLVLTNMGDDCLLMESRQIRVIE